MIKEERDTTKLRIVFDASAKREGPSLNECLEAGPSLLPMLMDILLRFRLKKVVLISDIEKAFLNVSISPEQRDFLRFLWVDDVGSLEPKVEVFRFTRACFGVISSPYLLNATIRHHLSKYEEANSEFVENVIQSLYCDDYVSSFDSEDEAFAQFQSLKQCFREAGFNMRKWKSNSNELAAKIKTEEEKSVCGENTQQGPNCDDKKVKITHTGQTSSLYEGQETGPKEKVLGLSWNKDTDKLCFDFAEILKDFDSEEITKRTILSTTAKIFDPLGVLSPAVIALKVLFQKVCKEKTNWDSPVSEENKSEFRRIISDLKSGGCIQIDRSYLSKNIPADSIESVELHGFSDASVTAYGACVYIVYRLKSGECRVSLVAAKSKVAPIDSTTIPRLELFAAHTLARLISNVQRAIESSVKIQNIFAWSDSEIAIHQILKTEKIQKQFVQNRVNEIRKLVPTIRWRHCPTKENPADLVSRGVKESVLKNSKKWWEGPEFLKENPKNWPNNKKFEKPDSEKLSDIDSENVGIEETEILRVDAIAQIDARELIDPCKYSNIDKLLRVTAYVMRFVNNIRRKIANRERKTDDLEIEEINEARNLFIKTDQLSIKRDKDFENLKHNLGVFEDEQGILRCGGRLENAPLPFETKHPILLSRESEFTRLLISNAHEIVKHNGVRETLSQLRTQYWVVQGRQTVRKYLSKCTTCRRFEGKGYEIPKPPPLPGFRLSDEHAFSNIGIDYAGPVYVKNIYGTDQNTYKAYILLITCASTRGIHLELVPDLGAESLKRGLSRFQSRRGVPNLVISDNGKSFKDKSLRNYLRKFNIDWRFNIERSPEAGGFFERLVRSVKRCLKKTLRNAKLTYEEFVTILTEVEGVLNSRPLTYGNEELGEPLTPAHLMIGRRILDRPNPVEFPGFKDMKHADVTRRAKHLHTVLNHFRSRFRREYLTELREHQNTKKPKSGEKVSVGDVVTIFEEKLPRQGWRMGRVERLLQGKDGQIRSAVVRVHQGGQKSTLFRRPLRKLYPVELNENEEEDVYNAEMNDVEPEITFVPDHEVGLIQGKL